METTNSLSVSKFLSLAEVLNLHKNYTIDDLYNAASEDKLPIYIRCEMWKIYSVVSIKREFANLLHDSSDAVLSNIFPDLLKVLEKGDETEIINMLVEISDAMEKLKNFRPNQEIPESISNGFFKGLFTIYPYEGIYKAIYSMPLFDFKPISPLTFGICQKGSANPTILLIADDLISDSTDYFFLSIDVGADIALTLNDAIKDNKLFVRKTDLDMLNGEIPAENLSKLFTHKYKSDELIIAVNAWLAAVAQYENAIKDGKMVKSKYLITEWLRINHPEIIYDSAAWKRISIIANWDDTPGPIDITDTK